MSPPMTLAMTLPGRVLSRLLEHGVEPGHRLGVATSGGPDSAALAHAVLALSGRGALGQVVLLHIDHGLRADSAGDAGAVHALALALARAPGSEVGRAAQVVIRKVDVDRSGASLERAAREARYQAFEDLAREHELRWILLAHTASDQAETVLMRIVRGTGVTGLAAIPEQRGMYLRPLLGATRQDIEDYVRAHQVVAVRDPMNEDMAFLRNRVRHRWLPALRAENPALDQALVRLAGSAAAQREVLDFAARALLDQARQAADSAGDPVGPGAGEHRLAVAPVAAAPEAVARRALAVAVEHAGGGPLEARHQRALHDLVMRADAGTVSLDLPGIRAVREYDVVTLRAPRTGAVEPDRAPGAGAGIRPEVHVDGPEPPYVVRRWQPGDRMRPARLRGRSRKLSDLFTDAKVPRAARSRAIIVARQSDGVIEWAEHVGLAWNSQVSVVLTRPDPVASNKA